MLYFRAMDRSIDLDQALRVLGRLLTARGERYELVAVGGGGLRLLGLITRVTQDIDVIARLEHGQHVSAAPLPEPLRQAVTDTARTLKLAPDWLNAGPSSQWQAGLPAGFVDRLEPRSYGPGLELYLASRYDQICLKIFAAIDQGRSSKHFVDLCTLRPTQEEVSRAADWVATQDASTIFAQNLATLVEVLHNV